MRVKSILLVVVILVILTACGGESPTEIPAPTVVPTHTPLPTATMIPTPSTPLAIPVIPVDMDNESSELYQ